MACAELNVVGVSEGGPQTQAAEKVSSDEEIFEARQEQDRDRDRDRRPGEESPDLESDLLQSHGDHAELAPRRLPPPDFPESLYELLCTLQEGRRLNDQRCSFVLGGDGATATRRRCHSEPNAAKPTHRVIFSSMTSLQREEFFELVAKAQARRLDEQRAQLRRSPRGRQKSRSFRGSLKQLSLTRRVPKVPPKEELYNMILTTQAQGRLEDQRSRAPGPMDDDDFFSLLLKVQGGRMDEQRTELPSMLQT
ncbi:G-protein-signaling modulator 3-like [Syngnathoides biaculeatus]|uniref:G-protein-signaling modulator 3-like n=1 Tax=Syngnathoides biaculeatus TaxID=300417 RepID=UPI002ADD76FF|nr:G-protein-signaling modulator 3-like [Syngnathoides biaculeatus]